MIGVGSRVSWAGHLGVVLRNLGGGDWAVRFSMGDRAVNGRDLIEVQSASMAVNSTQEALDVTRLGAPGLVTRPGGPSAPASTSPPTALNAGASEGQPGSTAPPKLAQAATTLLLLVLCALCLGGCQSGLDYQRAAMANHFVAEKIDRAEERHALQSDTQLEDQIQAVEAHAESELRSDLDRAAADGTLSPAETKACLDKFKDTRERVVVPLRKAGPQLRRSPDLEDARKVLRAFGGVIRAASAEGAAWQDLLEQIRGDARADR